MSETLDEIGQEVGTLVMDTVGKWQNQSARTLQSTMRILGMSELGGCREYIRASIAGDPKAPGQKLKWPAFVGTAVGDFLEQALEGTLDDCIAQETVTVTLPLSGIRVSGHSDATLYHHERLIDFKTRDGLEEVRKDGAKFKEYVQISGYLISAVQEGRLTEDATGHLVYVDRSGSEKEAYVVSVDVPMARDYLRRADERLTEVAKAIATGMSQGHLRDEPESWCFHVECPFYQACWAGYIPDEELEHPEYERLAAQYAEGREMEKRAISLKKAARDELRDVIGLTENWSINWQLRDNPRSGRVDSYIDVRRRLRPRAPKGEVEA